MKVILSFGFYSWKFILIKVFFDSTFYMYKIYYV